MANDGLKRARRNIRWIERYCLVPEGRDVGKPVKLRKWQKDIIREIYGSPTRRAIISFGRKNGKGLALDTPVPTPTGWRTMGDLRVGDEVFGSDGKPTEVLYVSPVHTGLRCWRLTFSDGTQIIADEQHRWLTRHRYRPWVNARVNGSGNGGRPVIEVVTTPQIAESVTVRREDGRREYNHKIAVAPAIETKDIDLPIDPYVLGFWLGDGTSACGRFTCGDQDLDDVLPHLSSGLGGNVSAKFYGGKAATIRTAGLGFQAALRRTGLLGNKHIPDSYFNAGTAQRRALLQGLMDSDGAVSKNGGRYPRAVFSASDKSLSYDVWRLARSLGLKATIREKRATLYGRDCGASYEVSFAASKDVPVFRLGRKQSLLPDRIAKRSRSLTIVGCEEVESAPTVCIKVAAKDSLFLVGYGCIPTHNTALSAFLLLLHLVGPEARANSQLYSAAQSREQAAVLFALAAKCVRMSADLNAVVIVRDTAKELACQEIGTRYRALSAEASTAYGLSPVFVVHDELGQVRGPRSELYEALETGSAAHEAPLSVVISTQAPTDADLMSVLIDDAKKGGDPRVKLALFTADPDADPFEEKTIRQANPAFGDFQHKDEILALAEDARRMPTRENEYRNLVLNQRVDRHAPFISRGVWKANGGKVSDDWGDAPVYAGLDLSSTADLTAFVPIAWIDGAWEVKPTFWLPGQGLAEKSRADRTPYDYWAKEGWLEAPDSRSIEYEYVAARIFAFCQDHNVRKIAFDRWGMKYLRPWLIKAGFTEEQVDSIFEEFGQGFQSMSPALRDLESALLNEQIRHGDHPVLTMCAANAVVSTNPVGDRKLDKAKASGRIDGMVALTMARAVAEAEEPAVKQYQMIIL